MKISIVKLKTGWFARLGLGTCGWHPFPWKMTHGRTAQQAFNNFIERHNITETCEMVID